MSLSTIVIKGARVHNLKNVSLELPKNALICFTGVSGSGKSSLAFDTLYAEGQRRYVESLSAYARQFLGQMQKPDVDQITGLAPAISIEQKATGHNPRSTVGTITELYDFLRVLYARIGVPHCVRCGREIGAQTREQIVGRILALPDGTRLHVLAPVVQGRKGEYRDLFDDLMKQGYLRARVDGRVVNLSDNPQLDRNMRHDIEVVIDRLVIREGVRTRLVEAVEGALTLGNGTIIVSIQENDGMVLPQSAIRNPQSEGDFSDSSPEPRTPNPEPRTLLFSSNYACASCGLSYEEPTPQMFSFNSPQGMCPDCHGLGTMMKMNPRLVVPDPSKSINQGAIVPLGPITNIWKRHYFEGVAESVGFTLDTPWGELTDEQQHAILYGLGTKRIRFTFRNGRGGTWSHNDTFSGVLPDLERRYSELKSERHKAHLEAYMTTGLCQACRGARLKPDVLAVTIAGQSIADVCRLSVADAQRFFNGLGLGATQMQIAEEALKEIRARLDFLMNVGLNYLTLDRTAPTLSGGEAQRIRLASQIGRGLVGVMYVLDEPSIGLHPRDNRRLLDTLCLLRDQGNTVIIVEHDEETMWSSDYLVDFGPGAGVKGGEIVAAGPPAQVAADARSLTGQYLRGERSIPIPPQRRALTGRWVEVVGATHNNLKNLTVKIPVGVFTCVTGVSGSGKSSLINDILYAALARTLNKALTEPGAYRAIRGSEHLDKVIDIDQSPIGRTPRSNPATYTKVFDDIRALFAELPESKVRGYKPGRFSFNVPGGRCEACEGNGANKVEMDFLADVWVTCPVCEGKRFDRETLEIKYKGKSIANVLDMDVQEALELFQHVPTIAKTLKTLHDVGLDYIKLGQPAPTLSGGEAQRVKLARELCKRSTGRTLYVLDEPTTGLHFADIQHLLDVLHTFVDAGNTVIVIEHNMDVVKTADWIIDLGPEGGDAGGRVIATGIPEDVARVEASYTGMVLRRVLGLKSPRSQVPGPKSLTDYRPDNGAITHISVLGAREHNLKDINVTIPRERMTVFTGVSGSGKTSLALDTIYAEGQRRYVESLSAYARQFLQQMQKPKVDHITGLSPAISIEQKSAGRNPRSTVGTITEVYEYLRALYALVGVPHCPRCRVPIGAQTPSQIVDRLLALPDGTRATLMAPVEPNGAEDYAALLDRARRAGYVRVRVDGTIHRIEEPIQIDKRRKHEVGIVVDRVVMNAGTRQRLADSVETALRLSEGIVIAAVEHDTTGISDLRFSRHYSCPSCGQSYDEITPQSFSFNHQAGMCQSCEGLGMQPGIDLNLLIPDWTQSIRDGGITAWWDGPMRHHPMLDMLDAVCREFGFTVDTPLNALTPDQRNVLLYGSERWISLGQGSGHEGAKRQKGKKAKGGKSAIRNPQSAMNSLAFQFRGIFPTVELAARYAYQFPELSALMQEVPCSACKGGRLRPESLAVLIEGTSIAELCALSIEDALRFVQTIPMTSDQREVVGDIMEEVQRRLRFLVDVGLEYLSLDRRAPTLSGGEAQRIRLASQIGSGLTGVLYVLDEPTIGLHPRDNRRLIQALKNLRDLGNTLIMVEHDRETLEASDYLVDFGPGAGVNGGQVVTIGPPAAVKEAEESLTGQYLSDRLAIQVPQRRRTTGEKWLTVIGARHNNLKSIDVKIPLGLFVCVTGVSGSGKSSLVNDTLYPALASTLHRAQLTPAPHDQIEGLGQLDKVINIDQSPIGYSPRSDPATYVGVFDELRHLYAIVPDAKVRGYTARRFSFNVPGGRCEACQGLGVRKIEMHFLADVWVTCEACEGTRYTRETLEVKYKGKSISETLTMTVAEALAHFESIPKIRRMFQTLYDVGLDYIQLGQSAITLSGGEAQRVKLAKELSRPGTGKTIYLLDEPTTGLHFDDIKKLLAVLNRLIDKGNTVLVIEHNLDVVKTADWIIDLGPDGGDRGGRVVAAGPPEDVAAVEASYTGQMLRGVLKSSGR